MRRERLGVICDLLKGIVDERQRRPDPRLSNLAAAANIAYDRMQAYLVEMHETGLISPVDGSFPRLTARGSELLRESRVWTQVLVEYGLT